MSRCRLLELPDELLRACLPPCHSGCAASRQLLNASLDRMRLCLGLYGSQDEDGKRTLLRLERALPALKKLKTHIACAQALERLLAPPLDNLSVWLENIVDIAISSSLQDRGHVAKLKLDRLIQECLVKACPQLQRLTLQQVHVIQQQTQPAALPHLEELTMDYCIIDMPRDVVQQQLQAMPSLQRVKLITDDPVACDNFSSKLTYLRWEGLWGDHMLPYCPMLTKLVVSWGLCIRDDMIQTFLQATPNLERLQVDSIDLRQDWSHKLQSQWKQLTFKTMPPLYSFAHLPVGPHQLIGLYYTIEYPHIRVLESSITTDIERHHQVQPEYEDSPIDEQTDVQLMARANTVVQQAGGLKWYQDDGTLCSRATFVIANNEPLHMQQLLMSSIPIFSNVQKLTLKGQFSINTALLAVVGQSPNCKSLTFSDCGCDSIDSSDVCSFDPGIWKSMISLLPHVEELNCWCSAVTAHDIWLLCCTAVRALYLYVWYDARHAGREWHNVEAAAQRTLVQAHLYQTVVDEDRYWHT